MTTMMNPAVFPVQNYKTHPNCIWMQTAASPRSQREKNHQVFFFISILRLDFFVVENLKSGGPICWQAVYKQNVNCGIFPDMYLFYFFSLLQRSVISPTPPPGGSVHVWGLLQAVVTLLLVSSVEGEVSPHIVTSWWADCCCGIEPTLKLL